MSGQMKGYQHISKIEERLYLGDISSACNDATLSDLNIQMVITLLDTELPNERKVESIEYHHLIADDRADEDLLTHFPQMNAWITFAQSRDLNVLVHCRAGVSRSATIVLAFLMNKYQMSYTIAKQLVRSKRPQIDPNSGFEIQLIIYEEMNFRLNPNNRKFRQYLLDFLLFNSLVKNSINAYFDRRQYCESLTHVKTGNTYQCFDCGQKLFSEIHVIQKQMSANDESKIKVCDDIYVEPQFWMKDTLKGVYNSQNFSDTNIKCPTCQKKLGFFREFFKPFECECSFHRKLFCLYIKIKAKKVKINVK